MNVKIFNLINLVNRITLPETFPARDIHYEITLSYNGGDPGWYVAHDGKVWQMEEYLKPSQNGFKTQKQAERALERVLLDVSKDYLELLKEKDNPDKGLIAECELEYTAAEMNY